MENTAVWFKGSNGLNDKVDPFRLRFDKEAGVSDLAIAYNVVHDRTGGISRRLGFSSAVVEGNCHSLFFEGGECLFVKDTSLCVLAGDFSYKVLKTVAAGKKMSYAQIGDRIFFSNGDEIGFVRGGVAEEMDAVENPRMPDSTKEYSSMPAGSIIRWFNGRLYCVQGSVIWYSEPFGYNLINLAKNYFPMPADVIMLEPVGGGFYVGTRNAVYFFAGMDAEDVVVRKVGLDPAIEGTAVVVNGADVLDGRVDGGLGIMWTGKEGIYFGSWKGNVVNLTKDKLTYPSAISGGATANSEMYIVTLEP